MENARLAKDNAKLTTDYQNVEKKFREEAAKIKDMDDKMRILEKKLEAAGLQSSSGSKKERRPTQMATIRYRPTLKNPFELPALREIFFWFVWSKTKTRKSNIAMASDLSKRLTQPPEAFEALEFEYDPDMIRYRLNQTFILNSLMCHRYTKDCMAQILFSKPIEFADVYALHELFSTDSGRRCFTQIMQSTMKEVRTKKKSTLNNFLLQIPTLVLSDNSFELLLYLINIILQQMDISDRYVVTR